MSSGERAYLNFFSWINLLSFFHEISDNVLASTRENILLLIDEIELYCHPEWQRQFIIFLLEELSEQFVGNKIQIILATHSPIVLSDIPLSNTVYIMQNEDGQSHIENRTKHKETFAANIYKLFDDSFFLSKKGAVGEFARNTINSVFKDLNDVLEKRRPKDNLKKERIKFVINRVGEPVIKNRLTDMYIKVFSEDKDALLSIQNKQIVELQEQIRNGKIVSSDELRILHEQLTKTLEEVNKLLPNEGDSI
ncbi:ATP-binding protein [Dehalobacter sp. DCM]|uniref:AAA family ATPase n=1 Tax=Dehalobacter sp. DCM TaxID=2907827 RepID=UPI0030813DD6|nr:ATP-binding protein [Dehalobacter sp. DCM]